MEIKEINKDLKLQKDENGLSLVGKQKGSDTVISIRGDFSELTKRISHNNLTHELVVKAAKIKGIESPKVLDATAGMGEDSFLLAAAGFNVTLYEYDPVIAALLRDALDRASRDEKLSEIVSRMTLIEGNSIDAMEALKNDSDSIPDVILLDPMFPERSKSGMIKKKFQLLQQLESPCSDENELMDKAMALNPKKIIVKRPAKGPYLAGKKPSYSIDGKAIRYDCYVNL